MRRWILTVSVLLTVCGPARAGLDDGLKALKRGDHAAAIKELRPLADAGNDTAQFQMGEIYRRGLGTGQDFKVAADWYRKAAEAGHSAAQGTLGGFYAAGIGVPQDFQSAYFWLIVSVVWSAGDLRDDAMISLGEVAKMLDNPSKIAIGRHAAQAWRGR